jgi:hypothetical protein
VSNDVPVEQLPELVEAEETVDAVPVLVAEVRALDRVRRSPPAVQAAAVAATGFVAGAATIVAIRRRTARKAPSRVSSRKRRETAETLSVLGTRSFLLDVHLLGRGE